MTNEIMSALTILTELKRLAIAVSFRSKPAVQSLRKLTKPLILLDKVRVERANGINPSFLVSWFLSL